MVDIACLALIYDEPHCPCDVLHGEHPASVHIAPIEPGSGDRAGVYRRGLHTGPLQLLPEAPDHRLDGVLRRRVDASPGGGGQTQVGGRGYYLAAVPGLHGREDLPDPEEDPPDVCPELGVELLQGQVLQVPEEADPSVRE